MKRIINSQSIGGRVEVVLAGAEEMRGPRGSYIRAIDDADALAQLLGDAFELVESVNDAIFFLEHR